MKKIKYDTISDATVDMPTMRDIWNRGKELGKLPVPGKNLITKDYVSVANGDTEKPTPESSVAVKEYNDEDEGPFGNFVYLMPAWLT